MPQLRVLERFFLRPILWSPRCQAIHALPALESSEQVFFAPSVERQRPPGFRRPRILSFDTGDAATRYSTLLSASLSLASSPVAREAHPKLSYVFRQWPWSRCLHSSGVCSKDVICDGRWAVSSRSERPLVDPGPGEAESLEEVAVDGEEFFDRYNSSYTSRSRSTVVHEVEVITELDSSSTASINESDLSELGLEAGNDLFEEEDIHLTAPELELEVSEGKEGASKLSELEFFNFSDAVSTNGDSGEGFLNVSERREEHNRHPYLHILSVNEVREILEKARAKDVRILQVRECCEWVDQLVFASGRSSRHLRGLADALVYKVKQRSKYVGPNSFPTVEGRDGEQWMAVDCGKIVVHLFLEDARSYYNLEEFWRKQADPRLVESF